MMPVVKRMPAWLLVALLTATPSFAQPPDERLQNDVRQWVRELDGASLAVRQKAEQQLIEAGPEALSLLPPSGQDLSAEAAIRLERVRSTLTAARTRAEAAALTIRLDQATTVAEALEAISRDSGIEFKYRGETQQPFPAVATPLTFWHAVDLVLDHAGLDINFHTSERETLVLVPRDEQRESRVDSAAYSGVYRVEPVSVTARRVLRQPDLNALNVSIEIAWEPRLTPIGLTIPIDQLSGRYLDGQPLRPQPSGESIDIGSTAEVCFSEFYLPLQLPDGQPKRIESLQGVIHALLPGRREQFELSLGAGTREKTVDAMTVRIDDVRSTGTLHEVRVGIELRDAARSLESHRQWIFDNPVHVRLADGSQVDYLGLEVYRQTLDSVGVGYLFDLGEKPREATLIYESPTSVVESEVPFLIQDIVLP